MEGSWEIVPAGWQAARYRGSEGEAEFEVVPAYYGGEPLHRGGKAVLSIASDSVRWVGGRQGQAMSESDRARILTAVREHYRRNGQPYELSLPSGEIEDESGHRQPGFRSPLPRAEHSDGWSLEDLWLSPEYPDANDYPPAILYTDATGAAEIPRSIEVAGGVRQRVIDSTAVRWISDRTGDPVTAEERDRILTRVRSAYDRWGEGYRVR